MKPINPIYSLINRISINVERFLLTYQKPLNRGFCGFLELRGLKT